MRFNKLWLDDLVPNTLDANQVSDIITMAGLEVDSVDDVTGVFSNVVIGEVKTCVEHPDSDHLHVTTIDVGTEILDIVCGAPNCRVGLKVACAKVGAVLPGDFKIKPAKLRGVPSNGMLCSYKELGLREDGSGIIEFPSDAKVGTDLHDYLQLNDKAIEVDLTANRADCLSLRGLAREFGVLTKADVNYPEIAEVDATISDSFPVEVEAKEACPRYLSRVLKGLDLSKSSPVWMQERLRRANIRSIDAVVDVTNYVMLELGQPMHAFDLNSLQGKICVRNAKNGEHLVLLDETDVELHEDTLIIADDNGPLALAGIFGGLASGVKSSTTDIMLESAFFAPFAIKNRARSYSLATDASHRYERGVDYTIQQEAMNRATAFLLEICGGSAGTINEVFNKKYLPLRNSINVPLKLVKDVIDIEIPVDTQLDILTRLGMEPKLVDNSYITVQSPSWRYDIAIPVDICEEIARVYGYDNIPNCDPVSPVRMIAQPEAEVKTYAIKSLLSDLGYHEVVTYSFVEPKALATINPEVKAIVLPSPISAEMSAMRTTLWTGLISTVAYNLNRQMTRNCQDLDENTISLCLDRLSIYKRPEYLTPPSGLDTKDIFPWVYNRELSYLRRPYVRWQTEDGSLSVTFGFRSCLLAGLQLTDLLYSGRLKNVGRQLSKLLGKFEAEKGRAYNEEVRTFLQKSSSLKVWKHDVSIKPKGNLAVATDDDLGDIDVMAYDEKRNILYSIECKNTNTAKNVREMKKEMDDYLGRGENREKDRKKALVLKHLRRHQWLMNNIDQVVTYIGASKHPEIKSMMLTSEVIPTSYLRREDTPLSILNFQELKNKGIG